MHLEIKDIKQNSFKISVKASDTIHQVKEKIKTEIPVIDVHDQTLIHSGHILPDDRTVEECEIDKTDYLTLIYHSSHKDQVREIIEKVRNVSKFEVSKDSSHMSQDDDTSKTFSTDLGDAGEELISDADASIDSEADEMARSVLLESIPDVKKLCEVIVNDPEELPKHLSMLSRHAIENILENKGAFTDFVNADDYGSGDGLKKITANKKRDVIDRLAAKGYSKEMAMQVYEACDFNEGNAAELLNYLH